MEPVLTFDVIIVGGGPAGSTCAWKLVQAGIKCLVLDKAVFPRTKLCAGWITPAVVDDLEIDISTYPHRLLTFDRIQLRFPLIGFNPRTVQYSIRRYEFDDWLLARSGAEVRQHDVSKIRRDDEFYVIDETFRCKYLVGAGGTRCPVYRNLFRASNPRAKALQAVTLEVEFPCRVDDNTCKLWFFEHGLPGYSWYVPKADGYLNVGIGAMAARLKSGGDDIKQHWSRLNDKLGSAAMVKGYAPEPKGYSYFIRGDVGSGRIDNAFILGDAAGLATRDLCEGIGPAVRSGLLAANSIIHGHAYQLNGIETYSSSSWLARKLIEYKLHRTTTP
jgi:flavin-dependent dehydrogenase